MTHTRDDNAYILIQGGRVLTMDASQTEPIAADVLIKGSKIVEIGPNLQDKAPGKIEVIDARGKLVMPGLIDNHWHMWQGLIPGVSADDTFGEYFARALDGLGPKFTPQDCALGVTLSALAGLDAGKTTVVNWDHGALTAKHAAASISALQQVGIRAIEAYGPPANSAEWFNSNGAPTADDVRTVYKENIKPGGLVSMGLAIRGPEFSTMERVTADVELARELHIPVTMHAGIPGFFHEKNSPKLMEDAGLLGDDITFVHCNAMGVDDFKRIKQHDAHISGSPEVEMQMGFGPSPLGAALEGGAHPTVSVDVPTAVGADLLLQARIMLQRQREADNAAAFAGTGKPAPALLRKDQDALAYVTTYAAESINMSDRIGSLAPGKCADVIVVDLNDADTFLRPVAPALLQAVHPGNITDVLVDGQIMKRGGELVCISKQELKKLREDAKAANQRLLQA